MLYLIIYFGIGFLGAMVLEWTEKLNPIFDDVENVSTRTKIMGKLLIHLILTIYWPFMLSYYISVLVDTKKGRA